MHIEKRYFENRNNPSHPFPLGFMSNETNDTIVAVSSPPGMAFQAIIKISGPDAINCVKNIFTSTSDIDLESVATYTSIIGNVCIREELLTAPAVLYIMKRPHSYTREDVVEIHTLGSEPLLEMILSAILSQKNSAKNTVRLSQPGEFSKRAFLHGRIDLAQAEAVMRIIQAQTDSELKFAVAQLEGSTSQRIKHIQDEATSLCSYIEASIDFSDQDIELISTTEIINKLEELKGKISRLLTKPETGKISSEGIDVVLYGVPNVGKSSLVNALLGKNRSIVSKIPGTTRDVVTDILEIEKIRFKLNDTAGIDNAKETIASMAVEKTNAILKKAQITLLVLNGNTLISEQLREIPLGNLTGSVIIVINKCDLQKSNPIYELPAELKKYQIVRTSALTGAGLEGLKKALVESALSGGVTTSGCASFFNMRQKEALQRSSQSINQALELARNGESCELIAIDLRAAIDSLGEIVGAITTEDVLDKIFSVFCIGK